MKIFEHDFIRSLELEQVNGPEGRYYQDPSGHKYCSVTRFVDEIDHEKKMALARWRERVGEEEANRISQEALTRGSIFHELCEKYLMNTPKFAVGVKREHFATFSTIRKYLDRHLGTLYGVEHRLCSKRMGLAGTSDVICEWRGENVILDFKTSKRFKSESQIYSYFLQTTIYAMMVEENYNMKIDGVVILMAVDNGRPLIFERKTQRFRNDLERILEKTNGYKILSA